MSHEGLKYLSNQGELSVYSSELPLYGEVIRSDKQGSVWVGTYYIDYNIDSYEEEGSVKLAYLNKQGLWTTYEKDLGLLNPLGDRESYAPSIQSLLDDKKGGVWIITDESYSDGMNYYSQNSLFHLNAQGQWKVYDEELGEVGFHLTFIDEKGNLWIGMTQERSGGASYDYVGKGLARLNSQDQLQIYTKDNSELPDDYITKFLSDGHGGLWLVTTESSYDDHGSSWGGTGKGLAHLDEQGKWTIYTKENKLLPSNRIMSILADEQDGLWVGTTGELAHLTFGKLSSLARDITDPDIIKTILSDKHAAIIIAGKGSGAEKGDMIWDTTKAVTSYIYRTLYDRGFLNSQIYYLSPEEEIDFNGDNYPDKIVDAPHPGRPLKVTDVEEAFRWATQRGKLDQPLYFFFMDHGDSNSKLTLSPEESLEATKLKELLDNYQTTTGNEVILVIDACYSGIFLDGLIDHGFKRAIISSTSDGLSYPYMKQSFSYFLANALGSDNFLNAFNRAKKELPTLLGTYKSYSEKVEHKNVDKVDQIPRFEDGSQGEWLKQVSINGNFRVENSLLAVKELIPSTILSANQSLPLKVEANFDSARPLETAERITRVWAIVKPPKMDLVIGVNGTPIITFDYVPLSRNREVKNLWQTHWNKGIYNGDYEISFYAEDDKNNIASSNSIFITVQNGTDPPPQANVQIQVEKNRYQRGEIFNATIIQQLGWSYDLYVAVTLPPEGKEYVLLNNTNKFLPASTILPWVLQGRAENQVISIIKDFELPMDLPTGQYCLWAILSPQDEDVFRAKSQGLWGQFPGQQCFEVF